MRSNEELEKLVREWAQERGIMDSSDPKSQLLKTMAELGELADAINKDNMEEIVDGIGDVQVTLILTAALCGLTTNMCLAHAYNEIANRKGKMVNGVFVKEES